jgi:hypothetical protein
MKPDTLTDPTVKILLDITRYGVNVISGQSIKAVTSGSPGAIGRLTLYGTSKPPGMTFWINVYPDGSALKPAFVRESEKVVEMSINLSQMNPTMEVLKSAKAAHALYRVDGGVVYADVHGEFTRTNQKLQDIKKSTMT